MHMPGFLQGKKNKIKYLTANKNKPLIQVLTTSMLPMFFRPCFLHDYSFFDSYPILTLQAFI